MLLPIDTLVVKRICRYVITEIAMSDKRSMPSFVAAILLSTAGYSSVAQEAPYSLRWQIDDVTEIKKLEFTVLADELTINSVTVNKGNCQIATTFDGAVELKVNDAVRELGQVISGKKIEKLPQKQDPNKGFPLHGLFGERLGVFVPISCNILLVQTKTDHGNWTDRFEPK